VKRLLKITKLFEIKVREMQINHPVDKYQNKIVFISIRNGRYGILRM
jgi:hypothetical protein